MLDGAGDNYFFSSGDLGFNPLKHLHHRPLILFQAPHFSAQTVPHKGWKTLLTFQDLIHLAKNKIQRRRMIQIRCDVGEQDSSTAKIGARIRVRFLSKSITFPKFLKFSKDTILEALQHFFNIEKHDD